MQRDTNHADSTSNDDSKNSSSCAHCAKHVRVEKVSQLQSGHHIAVPGKKLLAYDEKAKRKEMIYKHHAIVVDILERNDERQQIEVNLVHMNSPNENEEIKLCQSSFTFDLKLDDIYIVHYLHPRYPKDKVAERAIKTLANGLRFTAYNLLIKNCEHFATWCVVGDEEDYNMQQWWKTIGRDVLDIGHSFQVTELVPRVGVCLNYILGPDSRIEIYLIKLFKQPNKLVHLLNNTLPKPFLGLDTVNSYIRLPPYFLYCIIVTVYYALKNCKNEICNSCLFVNVSELWYKLFLFGVALAPFMDCGIVSVKNVLDLFFKFILFVAFESKIPCIRDLVSPYSCNRNAIASLKDLHKGDIVSLIYCGLPHVVLITEFPTKQNDKHGTIRAIHYALNNILTQDREIREDVFHINLNSYLYFSSYLKKHDCQHLKTYSPEEAVDRAKKRIGEKKWHWNRNRSDHLCFWAKVKEPQIDEDDQNLLQDINSQSDSKNLSSWFIGEKDVYLKSDIEIGDYVKVNREEGFVAVIDGDDRQFVLKIFTVKNTVVLRRHCVNLNKDTITVFCYHPSLCHPKPERTFRASSVVEEVLTSEQFKEFSILLDTSGHQTVNDNYALHFYRAFHLLKQGKICLNYFKTFLKLLSDLDSVHDLRIQISNAMFN